MKCTSKCASKCSWNIMLQNVLQNVLQILLQNFALQCTPECASKCTSECSPKSVKERPRSRKKVHISDEIHLLVKMFRMYFIGPPHLLILHRFQFLFFCVFLIFKESISLWLLHKEQIFHNILHFDKNS
jgi:hypothetical protein